VIVNFIEFWRKGRSYWSTERLWICLISLMISSGRRGITLECPCRSVSLLIILSDSYFRIPWQWDSSAHAGFTSGEPWMQVNNDYQTCNVAAQLKDNNSVHSFWKHALKVRKAHEVLVRKISMYSFCLYLKAAVDIDRYMAISSIYQTTMNKCSRTFVPLRIPRPWSC